MINKNIIHIVFFLAQEVDEKVDDDVVLSQIELTRWSGCSKEKLLPKDDPTFYTYPYELFNFPILI